MANQQGFSAAGGAGDLAAILRHYDRTKMYTRDGELRYAYYPNLTQRGADKTYNYSEIDAARTHLNYNLAPEREGGQLAFVEKRLGEIYCHKSALKNAMVDWVVTLPDLLQYQGREREFFQTCYDFMAAKYGEQNVVSAYVHMDERQPHMHFAFIPVVEDPKHEQGWKLSKKAVNTCERLDEKTGKVKVDTRNFSRAFHETLNAYVEATMSLELGRGGIVLTDEQRDRRTIKENMRVPELREAQANLIQTNMETFKAQGQWRANADAANQEYARYEQNKAAADDAAQKVSEARQMVETAQGEVSALEAQKEGLEREIDGVGDRLERLRRQEREAEAEIKALEAQPVQGGFWQDVRATFGGGDLGERERAAAEEARRIQAEFEAARAGERRCQSDLRFYEVETPRVRAELGRAESRVSKVEAARDRIEERVKGLDAVISRAVRILREIPMTLPRVVREIAERVGVRVLSPIESQAREAWSASRSINQDRQPKQRQSYSRGR